MPPLGPGGSRPFFILRMNARALKTSSVFDLATRDTNVQSQADWFDYEKREMVHSSQVYGFEPAKKPDQQETA